MRYDMIWRGFVQKLRIGPKFMALKRRNHHQPGLCGQQMGPYQIWSPPNKLSTFRSTWVWPMGPQKRQLFVVNKTTCKVGKILGHTQVRPIKNPGMRGYKQVVGHITVAPDLEDASSWRSATGMWLWFRCRLPRCVDTRNKHHHNNRYIYIYIHTHTYIYIHIYIYIYIWVCVCAYLSVLKLLLTSSFCSSSNFT